MADTHAEVPTKATEDSLVGESGHPAQTPPDGVVNDLAYETSPAPDAEEGPSQQATPAPPLGKERVNSSIGTDSEPNPAAIKHLGSDRRKKAKSGDSLRSGREREQPAKREATEDEMTMQLRTPRAPALAPLNTSLLPEPDGSPAIPQKKRPAKATKAAGAPEVSNSDKGTEQAELCLIIPPPLAADDCGLLAAPSPAKLNEPSKIEPFVTPSPIRESPLAPLHLPELAPTSHEAEPVITEATQLEERPFKPPQVSPTPKRVIPEEPTEFSAPSRSSLPIRVLLVLLGVAAVVAVVFAVGIEVQRILDKSAQNQRDMIFRDRRGLDTIAAP